MTTQAKKIIAEALSLPHAARAKLTEELILSFDDDHALPKSEALLLEEIARRRIEVAKGKKILISHKNVMLKVRSKLNAAYRRTP